MKVPKAAPETLGAVVCLVSRAENLLDVLLGELRVKLMYKALKR